MKEMIKAMVQEMVMQSIKEVMSEMMGASSSVAKAEVVAPAKQEMMSRADFLALEESNVQVAEAESTVPVELVYNPNFQRTLLFNQHVSKDIWTINWIKVKKAYPNVKYDKSTHGFKWNKEHHSEFVACARVYNVTTQLTEDDKKTLVEYRKLQAQKKADYYAKKAQE